MARIDNGHDGFVIAPNLNKFPSEIGEPDCACHHYGEKFLPFHAHTLSPVLLMVRGLPTLEPLPIQLTTTKTKRCRGIGVQF